MLKGSAHRFSSHFIKEYRARYALCIQLSTTSVNEIKTVRVHEGYDALLVPATESFESRAPRLNQPRITDVKKDHETENFKQNADELLTKRICASGTSFNSVMLSEFRQFADFISLSHHHVHYDTYLKNKVVQDIKNDLEQELSSFLSSLTNSGCTPVFVG
ncbi:hypothetical protein P9112_006978 [Eukaryota sp. TZLM1-RC]